MNEQEVIALVAAQAKEAGSMRELARRWGITVSYVSDLLNGRRAPGPKILGPLGLERVKRIEYRPVKKSRG
jgi:transcriptional regulator with XRE-family HTH domain